MDLLKDVPKSDHIPIPELVRDLHSALVRW